MASSPRTVEEIFKDFSSRRDGIVRALTQGIQFNSIQFFIFYFYIFNFQLTCFFCTDVDEFYALCDPGKWVVEDLNYYLLLYVKIIFLFCEIVNCRVVRVKAFYFRRI